MLEQAFDRTLTEGNTKEMNMTMPDFCVLWKELEDLRNDLLEIRSHGQYRRTALRN